MIRIIVFLCLIFTASLQADACNDLQMLHLRRIKELWQVGEFEPMKQQVREFFFLYPDSPFKDQILVCLGDAEWREGNYREAVRVFDRIQTRPLSETVLTRKADSLYRLNADLQLQSLLEERIHRISEGVLTGDQPLWIFYYAEALAREGRRENNEHTTREAINYYHRILHTHLDARARLGLAGAYASIGQRKEAAQLYLQLSQELPEQRESLLMLAGQLQASYDPNGAIATLNQMKSSSSARAAAANCQRVALFISKRPV